MALTANDQEKCILFFNTFAFALIVIVPILSLRYFNRLMILVCKASSIEFYDPEI